ncbi:hypothetical protein GCM10020358_64380 [Amorphoplanes nipponensis]|uniref:Prepilin-type N-terminal cleavage/methylation domain-containing protein n=1 Tax=Actinoplanes nipponensis TaxID=135950 RepID=A0A919JMN9_9ACTN|nr:putative Ig domain-containing protein [Actinoplanes nipponensis]GIE52157.1 hypothetical protein Ani05nite_56910 [Actinoplanes nipponensis]
MPTDRATVALSRGPRRARRDDDAGFTLIEMVVALAVIGTVMTAMAPFLAQSMIVVREQRIEQAAVEVTNDALERARALKPSSLLVGRGANAAQAQWAAAPAPVKTYLALMKLDSNAADPDAGATAALPTTPRTVTVGAQKYTQQWYVGRCWQPKVDPTLTTATIATCGATETTGYVPFFRVVVAVSWSVPSSINRGPCVQGACVYVATTLVSTGTDLVFDTKRPAPTATPPGNQLAYLGLSTSLQLAATGGWLPRTWTATGLPPGLTLTASTGAIAGTPTTAGSYPVTILVTDRDNKTDDATFTWAVAALPALTSAGDQTSRVGTAVSLPVAVTGGHQPMSWVATGLPAGLTVNATTGVITGTPTTEAKTMKPVTVTVTDAGTKTASVTFNWRVLTPVSVVNPGTQTFSSGSSSANFSVPVSGGLPPYTWQATDLPDGLTMSTSGVVSGTAVNPTRYVVTAVATDSAGGTGTIVVVCNVTPRTAELTVTSPLADRSSPVNVALTSFSAAAAGGAASRTWTGTNLPPGITISAAGLISGKPTAKGSSVVRLTVKDATGKLAHSMFVWTVT